MTLLLFVQRIYLNCYCDIMFHWIYFYVIKYLLWYWYVISVAALVFELLLDTCLSILYVILHKCTNTTLTTGIVLQKGWIYHLGYCQLSRNWVEHAWKWMLRLAILFYRAYFCMQHTTRLNWHASFRWKVCLGQKCLHLVWLSRFQYQNKQQKQIFRWHLAEQSTIHLSTVWSGSKS